MEKQGNYKENIIAGPNRLVPDHCQIPAAKRTGQSRTIEDKHGQFRPSAIFMYYLFEISGLS